MSRAASSPLGRSRSAPDERILTFLSEGPALVEAGRSPVLRRIGSSAIRRQKADPADLARLVARGLVARLETGEIALTPAGRDRLAADEASPEAETAPPLAARSARAIEGPDGAPATVLVDDAESPLAWLRRRRDKDGRPFMDEAAFRAGERLRLDFTRARLMPALSSNWRTALPADSGGGSRGGIGDLTDAAVAARARVGRAVEAVGPDLGGLLIDVCGFLKGLETVEAERGWPARSAKIVLRIALDRLAAHYGIAAEAQGPEAARGLRHWGAEGYRPTAG